MCASEPEKKWDVFISYATEDKEEVARPLAEALREHGYEVWYDDFALKLGDSLMQSINHGLAHSRFGVVILSLASLSIFITSTKTLATEMKRT